MGSLAYSMSVRVEPLQFVDDRIDSSQLRYQFGSWADTKMASPFSDRHRVRLVSCCKIVLTLLLGTIIAQIKKLDNVAIKME